MDDVKFHIPIHKEASVLVLIYKSSQVILLLRILQ